MLAAFRVHLAGHPLILALAVLALLWLAHGAAGRLASRASTWTTLRLALVAISLCALVVYAAVVIYYATDPHYFDAAEPTMTAVGWMFHSGHPIYHAVDSAERYAHIYGPMAFIAHGLALGLFGPSIEVSKWVGGSLALASLLLTFAALRSQTSTRRAVVITGIGALLLLTFRNYSFWTRAEPLLIFAVAAGLVAAVRGRGLLGAIALGVFAGLLWNLKATGVLYSLPLFVILYSRLEGWRTLVATGVAALVAALPFVVWSNVSLAAYLSWFRLSAGTGLVPSLFIRNIEWAAFFALPVLATAMAARSARAHSTAEWRAVTVTIIIATIGIAIAGSKPGAGPYHLLPLLPVVGYLVAQRSGRASSDFAPPVLVLLTVTSFIAVAGAIAVAQQVQFLSTMQERRPLGEIADIQKFVDAHPGVVDMGYGIDDPMTFERPVLVFRNNDYLIDQPAVGEHQLAGLAVPAATLDALARCRVNYWLIPKGSAPFTSRNMYPAVFLQPLFSDEFRRVFHETHALVATTEYFDAWQCRGRR